MDCIHHGRREDRSIGKTMGTSSRKARKRSDARRIGRDSRLMPEALATRTQGLKELYTCATPWRGLARTLDVVDRRRLESGDDW